MLPEDPSSAESALIEGLLREVAERLGMLCERGEAGAIDLRSLPLAPRHLDELRDRLGRGDVSARLDVAGASEIWETRYRGVWWVRHFDGNERVAVERIEIAPVPEILRAPDADVAASAVSLRADLGRGAATNIEETSGHGATRDDR